MRFKDRIDAGRRLALALGHLRGQDPVVLALARGGVPLGAQVAAALGAPLGVITPRKVGHPASREFAVAAVTEDGPMIVNEDPAAAVEPAYLEMAAQLARTEARRRREAYGADAVTALAPGRTVVLVDDGLATGLTMRAAVMAVKAAGARRVVVAVPVAPSDTVARLREEVDEVVALLVPQPFEGAIGSYYDDFGQVGDEEVLRHLGQA